MLCNGVKMVLRCEQWQWASENLFLKNGPFERKYTCKLLNYVPLYRITLIHCFTGFTRDLRGTAKNLRHVVWSSTRTGYVTVFRFLFCVETCLQNTHWMFTQVPAQQTQRKFAIRENFPTCGGDDHDWHHKICLHMCKHLEHQKVSVCDQTMLR